MALGERKHPAALQQLYHAAAAKATVRGKIRRSSIKEKGQNCWVENKQEQLFGCDNKYREMAKRDLILMDTFFGVVQGRKIESGQKP